MPTNRTLAGLAAVSSLAGTLVWTLRLVGDGLPDGLEATWPAPGRALVAASLGALGTATALGLVLNAAPWNFVGAFGLDAALLCADAIRPWASILDALPGVLPAVGVGLLAVPGVRATARRPGVAVSRGNARTAFAFALLPAACGVSLAWADDPGRWWRHTAFLVAWVLAGLALGRRSPAALRWFVAGCAIAGPGWGLATPAEVVPLAASVGWSALCLASALAPAARRYHLGPRPFRQSRAGQARAT